MKGSDRPLNETLCLRGRRGRLGLFTYSAGCGPGRDKAGIGFGGDEMDSQNFGFDQVDKEGTMMIREILARV